MIPKINVGNIVVFNVEGVEVPGFAIQIEGETVTAICFGVGRSSETFAGIYGFDKGQFHFPGERVLF